jgi:uncharacterized membrane protein YphA (DoxX/SURF4 family)
VRGVTGFLEGRMPMRRWETGVPKGSRRLPGVLLPFVAALEIAAALSILTGIFARHFAFALGVLPCHCRNLSFQL